MVCCFSKFVFWGKRQTILKAILYPHCHFDYAGGVTINKSTRWNTHVMNSSTCAWKNMFTGTIMWGHTLSWSADVNTHADTPAWYESHQVCSARRGHELILLVPARSLLSQSLSYHLSHLPLPFFTRFTFWSPIVCVCVCLRACVCLFVCSFPRSHPILVVASSLSSEAGRGVSLFECVRWVVVVHLVAS